MSEYNYSDAMEGVLVTTSIEPDLLNWLQQYTHEKTLLLLSGGSTADVAIKTIQQLPVEHQQNLTISLTDERFVDYGNSDSNWQLLINQGLPLNNLKTLPVLLVEDADIKTTEMVWAEGMQTALRQSTHVLAIFGIGADSHIAGLKPHSPLLWETQKITGSYSADDWQRITITPAFFSHIQSAVIYAKGDEKREAITLLKDDQNIDSYPDQLIKQTQDFKIYYQTGGTV
ncbi:6-phosphogluconolactonase [Microbacteriaceae bacterium]|nr:6-phosphogluconolactonase [Candidatus Saccharibacteria bacterium]